jgi:hypothetical protein
MIDITDKIDDIIEGKKKRFSIKIDNDILSQKKSVRIPTAKGNQYFKDKTKYTRKKKHKNEKDM